MITVGLDGATLGRCRLASSPIAEAVGWLRLAAAGRTDAVFGAPDATARSMLRHPDVALVAAVLPANGRGYAPDLLTPRPDTVAPRFADQLEQVRHSPDAVVETQVVGERFGGAVPVPVARSIADGSFARRVANGLQVFWRATLLDTWSQLSQVLAADIAYRAQRVATIGVVETLRTLHPDVDCDGRELRVRLPPWSERRRITDGELVLAPALFGWPGVSPQLCRPDQAMLRYPAVGLGRRRSGSVDRAFAALLGSARSRLLRDLDVPRTTGTLAERHRLAAATVSHHLQVMRECGLVVAERVGREVRYQRSHRGDVLLGVAD